MKQKNESEVLLESIEFLKIRKVYELQLLKEQLAITLDYLNPVNQIRDSWKEMIATTEKRSTLLKYIIEFASGFLVNKIMPTDTLSPIVKMVSVIVSFLKKKISGKSSPNFESVELISNTYW